MRDVHGLGFAQPRESRNLFGINIGKTLVGAVGGLIAGGPLGAVTGGVASAIRSTRKTPVPGRTTPPATSRIARPQIAPRAVSSSIASGPDFSCGPGYGRTSTGACVSLRGPNARLAVEAFEDPRDIVSPSPGYGRPEGEAAMGRYGVAMQPYETSITRAMCLPGMVLGKDGLCYNKGTISNKERRWPRGRRPLLTGGDMRAISQASAAAKKLETANKRLQSMGLLKKPASRRAPRSRQLVAGPSVMVQND